ncbi:MAG: tRNA (adenosine(37)-N6)-threonylcarbamoyltransferase complex ATPase subunit type 1 TsaE [Bacteroidia bacterium]|nr:tRNA (adenosine(37)-N6)-threonylcarbamoyltransferase complex ATPase subunit type 1 TsaE [Bacteroidia bacterium]
MKIEYQNLSELDEVAKKIINFAKDIKIWILEGDLGVGKTTLIKAIGKALGVTDTIQSPTYSLVNEYRTDTGEVIYHFDFYRIHNETEVMDMGYEEYFYDDKYCFVEWPSRISSLLPNRYVQVSIFLHDTYRTVELKKYE